MGIVVGFDVSEEFDTSIGVPDERAILEHFGFEGADEGLSPGVGMGIGARGHALAHPRRAQELSASAAAILAAGSPVCQPRYSPPPPRRSLWKISAGSVRRDPKACWRASMTTSARRLSASDPPTILREQRAMTTAR